MVLVMIEVAALVLAEKIKHIDASFTWPHPIEEGKLVSAVFMRTNNNNPYLLYRPSCKQQTKIEEIISQDRDWFRFSPAPIKEVVMTTGLCADSEGIQFYLFPLTTPKEHKISRKDIEKLFNIKVVD